MLFSSIPAGWNSNKRLLWLCVCIRVQQKDDCCLALLRCCGLLVIPFHLPHQHFSLPLCGVILPRRHCFKASAVSPIYHFAFPTYANIFLLENDRSLSDVRREGVGLWQRPESLAWLSGRKRRRFCLSQLNPLWLHPESLRDFLIAPKVFRCFHKHHLCHVGGNRQGKELLRFYFFFSPLPIFSSGGEKLIGASDVSD